MQRGRFEIRLLGNLEILRDGKPVSFPRSKKARALLAYLVATGHPHRRPYLCDLLWEGPADPRAALRWSLSKIRPLVNDRTANRLVTNRDRVGFEPHGAEIDLSTLRALIPARPDDCSTSALQEAAAQFRGAFLDGLDLPACYRFDAWCTAEREMLHQLHDAILSTLVQRLKDQPEEALRYARDRLLIDPFSEAAQIDLVRILGEMERTNEALEQYDSCRKMLEREFGRRPSAEMEKLRRSLTQSRTAPATVLSTPAATPKHRQPIIGRREEREILGDRLAAARACDATEVLVIVGKSGIGKTFLLEELMAMTRTAGGQVLAGRAFGVEMVRPPSAGQDKVVAHEVGPLPHVPALRSYARGHPGQTTYRREDVAHSTARP